MLAKKPAKKIARHTDEVSSITSSLMELSDHAASSAFSTEDDILRGFEAYASSHDVDSVNRLIRQLVNRATSIINAMEHEPVQVSQKAAVSMAAEDATDVFHTVGKNKQIADIKQKACQSDIKC